MVSALLFTLFIIFIFIRIPVSMAIGLATYIAFMAGGYDLMSIPQQMAASTKSVPLMAIPFFLLAGNLMNEMGITKKIFNFANNLVGSIRGGLAHVNILSSMIFAGISGSALADVAGLGIIKIKAMEDSGYEKPFSAAVTAASATVGPIIPPSIMMVVYAIMANVSVAEMFLAGVFPGVVIGVFLMIFVYLRVITGRQKCPEPGKWSWRELGYSLKDGILALLSPLIIVWGMVGGVVTPTEAGILAILYSFLLGFIFHTIKFRGLFTAIIESVISTALIMYIVAISSAMSWLITMEGTHIVLAELLSQFTTNKYVMLLLINIFLLLLGCILETLPAMMISVSVLLPIVRQFGIDPVHFGVILIFNLLIGTITPPMGISLYVMTATSGVKFETLVKSCFPFLVALLCSLLVITYFPQICMFLPRILLK